MKSYAIGKQLIFYWEKPWEIKDFMECVVKEVCDDHAITLCNDMTLWIEIALRAKCS